MKVQSSWVISKRIDVFVFVGPFVIGVFLYWILGEIGLGEYEKLSPLQVLVLFAFADNSHVFATLFRTYFDRDEFSSSPFFYGLYPFLIFFTLLLVMKINWQFFVYALVTAEVVHLFRQQQGFLRISYARLGINDKKQLFFDSVQIANSMFFAYLWYASEISAYESSYFYTNDMWWGLSEKVMSWGLFVHIGIHCVYFLTIFNRILREKVIYPSTLLITLSPLPVYALIFLQADILLFVICASLFHSLPYTLLTHHYVDLQRHTTQNSWFYNFKPWMILAVIILTIIPLAILIRFVERDGHWIAALGWTPLVMHYCFDTFLWKSKNSKKVLSYTQGHSLTVQ